MKAREITTDPFFSLQIKCNSKQISTILLNRFPQDFSSLKRLPMKYILFLVRSSPPEEQNVKIN